jgi:phosphoglucomutase
MLQVITITTKPYADQKPGTSGLRKKVSIVEQPNYIANFVQSIFDSLSPKDYTGKKLVIAGDGRYYNKEAIQIIFSIAAANGVSSCVISQQGIMSTPAASALIRHLNEKSDDCMGGVLLTASHNPGGKKNDFGIKFNTKNGGPALEDLTDKIYEVSKKIISYKTVNLLSGMPVPIDKIGIIKFGKIKAPDWANNFSVEVVSQTQVYTDLMKKIFDFEAIKTFLKRKDFTMVFDAMHGASVPYAKDIFGSIFEIPAKNLMHCMNLEDFGGLHPDPNLTYAEDLVKAMGLKETAIPEIIPDFGAACDGDADRNMILGKKFFVTPSDSLAIIVANYQAIPYFKDGLKGVARSMPTSAALQLVADNLHLGCYETPTGWKFFGNLMDAGKLSICGEESFGTGSDHIREKDGVWAILAWLSILALKNKDVPEGKLISVENIVKEHWAKFGRNYYCRYDYEKLETATADKVFAELKSKFKLFEDKCKGNKADVFEYVDPIDKSVSKNQGLRFMYADGSRFVFRLSGTGSEGATIRLYLEKLMKDNISMNMEEALKSIIADALELSKINEITGRKAPSVIT